VEGPPFPIDCGQLCPACFLSVGSRRIRRPCLFLVPLFARTIRDWRVNLGCSLWFLEGSMSSLVRTFDAMSRCCCPVMRLSLQDWPFLPIVIRVFFVRETCAEGVILERFIAIPSLGRTYLFCVEGLELFCWVFAVVSCAAIWFQARMPATRALFSLMLLFFSWIVQTFRRKLASLDFFCADNFFFIRGYITEEW